MAQKKISDLQLISAVTDGVNIPGDDGIETYRLTAAQLKSYILAAQAVVLSNLKNDIFDGLTAVTPSNDDYVVLADTSDSNKTKKALSSLFKLKSYRAFTVGTDTMTTADDTILASGSSGDILLPSAGNSGKTYRIIHGGTSLTQKYSLTTGGETVGGLASGVFKLCTKGEMVEVTDNGTNYIITDRSTTMKPESWTPTFDAGWGTAVLNNAYYWRIGNRMHGVIGFTSGTVSSSSSGITIPSNAVIDTTCLTVPNNNVGSFGHKAGNYQIDTGSGIGSVILAPGTSTSKIYCGSNAASGTTGSNASNSVSTNVTGSSSAGHVTFDIPVSDWQP